MGFLHVLRVTLYSLVFIPEESMQLKSNHYFTCGVWDEHLF